MGGLCVHEDCGCVGFISGLSKGTVNPLADQLLELFKCVAFFEGFHEAGFREEERIDSIVRQSAKLHGW